MKLLISAFSLVCFWSLSSLSAQDFTIVEDEAHYFFFIPQTFADRTEVGGEIVKYNHAHYSTDDLKVELVYLPGRTVAFQIQPFHTHSTARAYYDHLIQIESDLIADELTQQFFIISHSNLQKVLREGTLKSFLTFFQETYY